MKKMFAFTLAETLIVMGVIGVVAALTLPNLTSSTNNKEKVAKLQKIYSNLNDAYGRAVAVYGPKDEWCNGLNAENCKKRTFDRITEFMKYSKTCTISDACTLFGANMTSGGQRASNAVILADGAVVGFDQGGENDIYVFVDIDGPNKGANKNNIDYFTFYIYTNKGVSISNSYDNLVPNVNSSSNSSAEGASWVIRNGNMDYLKCPDKLSATVTTCN